MVPEKTMQPTEYHCAMTVSRLSPFRMMANFLVLISALTLMGCDDKPVQHEAILGKWRSNAELTLESLDGIKGISPQTRAFLANDFFGHLVIEIREDESRTFDARDDYDSGLEPYEVLEVADKFVRINAWSNFFQDYDERVLYLEGDCYYEIFVEFKFRSYFCRQG
jgi:hypothetical protein